MPSVRTVPSDFGDQDVQTETQAARLEREEGEKQAQQEAAQQEHHNVGKKKSHQRAKKEAAQVDGWIARRLAALPDGAAAALLAVNLLGVIGLGGFLGYRAWGMYERGRLGWQQIGIGMGVLGAVGAVEGVFTRYFYKAKDIKKQ